MKDFVIFCTLLCRGSFKMMVRTVIVVLLMFLVSCNNETNESSVVHFVERSDVKMSELVSEYTVIPLETRDDNLILDASMLRVWNGRIYILDCFSSSKGIYVFSLNGSYVGKIGSFGNGPGEYIMPLTIAVDEVGNRITVKDVARNRLLHYDADSLQCVEEHDMTFLSDSMEYLDNGSLLWYVGSGWNNELAPRFHLLMTDRNDSVISNHIPKKPFPKRSMYNVMTYFHKYGEELFFHHPFSNTIYCYDAELDSIKVAYTLSCDNLVFPTEEYVIENNDGIINQLKEDGYIAYYDLLENSDHKLCYFGTDKERYIGAYDKERQQGFYTNVNKIEDDMGLVKFGRPKTVYNDSFVGLVYMESPEAIPSNSVLSPYLSSNEDGNPMVVLYKLK